MNPLEGILAQLALFLTAWSGTTSEAPRMETATWEELASAPERHVGRPVLLFVQHRGVLEEWEPYMTRFSPGRYRAFRAWSDEQLPWLEPDYRAPSATLFVERGARLDRVLSRAAVHDRLALAVVVRSAHLGRPWVEVVGAQRARHTVPEGSVLHAERALELIERGAFDLAREQVGRALAAPLPAHTRGELEEIARRCEAAHGSGR